MHFSKRIVLLSAFLFCVATNVSSQSIKCRVISAKTGSAIPYANIVTLDNKRGCASDAEGVFFANLHDTVKISALGYSPVTAPISQLTEDRSSIRTIALTENLYNLEQAVVVRHTNRKARHYTIASYAKRKQRGTSTQLTGCQTAARMPNTLKQAGIIESVSFSLEIRDKNRATANLRIRIYKIDARSPNIPSSDLLYENVTFFPTDGWNTINLKKYNIPFPASGVYIGLESLETNKMVIFGQYVEPDICYSVNEAGSSLTLENSGRGWQPCGLTKWQGQSAMMLKMKIMVYDK